MVYGVCLVNVGWLSPGGTQIVEPDLERWLQVPFCLYVCFVQR